MKKTYIKPIVKIVETDNEAFLAGSTPGIGNPYDEGNYTGRSKRGITGDEWDFDEEF